MWRGLIAAAVILCLSSALPSPREATNDAQNLLAEAPGFSLKDPPTNADSTGFLKVDVVNVNKRVMVFVRSTQTEEGAQRRALIRDTWLQVLNRTSTVSLTKEHRKAISVWFIIPRDNSRSVDNQTVTPEGQLHGDISIIASEGDKPINDIDTMAAVLRWVNVAYFEKFDFLLFTNDDAYVNIERLETLCDNLLGSHKDGGEAFVYAGFVNSFGAAPESYHHKYFAPFAQSGTILVSRSVTSLLAREIGQAVILPNVDATIGHFLVPFKDGKPVHIEKFVPDIKNTYEDVVDPIVVLGVDEETMRTLHAGNPLPGFHKEMETRGIFIDPHPKDDYPECNGIGGEGCNMSSALRLLDADK